MAKGTTSARIALAFRGRLLAVILAAGAGAAGGLGFFTFVYAKGFSYLTDDPAACANCHVMTEQYDGWSKGSHRSVAVCNDCHTPPGFFRKYWVKARNGWNHSFAFTTGWFDEPIRITPANHDVTEEACRVCHADVVDMMLGRDTGGSYPSCIRCHREVGHP